MSDATMEARRGMQYDESLKAFYEKIEGYLGGNQVWIDHVLVAKEEADRAASRAKLGYERDREAVRMRLITRLEKLRDQDRNEWAAFLYDASSDNVYDWKRFVPLSPFRGTDVSFVKDDGYGRAQLVSTERPQRPLKVETVIIKR